jgi:hypothetical protein
MAGSKTLYLAKAVNDHVLGRTTYTAPATLYVLLSLAAFDPTATGSACNEIPSSGAYARVAVTNNTTEWPNSTSAIPSIKANANDIVFPTATADWGTPLSAYLADASSSGNLLYGADIPTSSDVAIGDIFKIFAGTFIFSED